MSPGYCHAACKAQRSGYAKPASGMILCCFIFLFYVHLCFARHLASHFGMVESFQSVQTTKLNMAYLSVCDFIDSLIYNPCTFKAIVFCEGEERGVEICPLKQPYIHRIDFALVWQNFSGEHGSSTAHNKLASCVKVFDWRAATITLLSTQLQKIGPLTCWCQGK